MFLLWPVRVWTVGHSTRSAEEFVAILQAHGIGAVADVRRYPASRRHPQFNAGPLAQTLAAAGIDYRAVADLGGRRSPRRDSRNTVWRHPSFRGYADYMETAPFRAAVEKLLAFAAERPTAIMCAEAVWWQCHRQMIADALKVRGVRVVHILDDRNVTEHPYTSAARIVEGRLEYGHAPDTLDRFWDDGK